MKKITKEKMKKTTRIKLIIDELKKLRKQCTVFECDTINAVLECYLYPLKDEIQDTERYRKLKKQ